MKCSVSPMRCACLVILQSLGILFLKLGAWINKLLFLPPTKPPIKWLRNRNADVGRKDSYRWVIVFMSSWAWICCYAAFTHIINLYCLPALYIELYSRAIGGMKKKKSCDFSPQNRISRSFHLLSATCCRLFPCWNVRKKELSLKEKEKKEKLGRISSTLNNNASINYPPLGPVCASPTGLTTVTPAPAPVWEDSLIFRTPYWLGLAQRFWLAASLRPVLTRGFWFG